MATQMELAQLAAAAYRETSDRNRIDPPGGWTQIAAYPDEAQTNGGAFTGFSAAAYRGPGGEIVIAYTGTKDWKDWPAGNLPAASGFFAPQVVQAAQFYWTVLNRPDVGAANKSRIAFTGHSLGGGLAALMGVFFNKPTVIFDPAPFRIAAQRDNAVKLQQYLTTSNAVLARRGLPKAITAQPSSSAAICANDAAFLSRATA